MSAIPPIRREVVVDADPATAFEVFTSRIGRWWPLAELSVHGTGGLVEFAGGQIVERSADGREAVWGRVTRWEPAAAVAFSWHPGRAPEQASHVEVTFRAAGPQTLVTLSHAGWEVFDDPAAARAEYGHGWPMALDRYRDQVSQGPARDDGETWVALLHQPGPAAPQGSSLLEDPRFAEHVAFLARMRDAGYLIAAGPLPEEQGAGMTILRLPGAGQLERAAQLATEEDRSVATGFLTVEVRPWRVVMQAGGTAETSG